jgi:hypothetical protein
MNAKKCSVCSKGLFYDVGVNYENQKDGTLYCSKCVPKDKTDILELSLYESVDAGIKNAATRMRVPSSAPNRRAESLPHATKK